MLKTQAEDSVPKDADVSGVILAAQYVFFFLICVFFFYFYCVFTRITDDASRT